MNCIAAYHRSPAGPVSFGTSGHRGTSLKGTFTEAHVLAISEAICRYRQAQGIDGPLFVARDTHALSEPAFHTALAVFSAHGLDVRVDADGGYTPTPALSHAILTHPGVRRRSCSRRRTTRPRTAATSTTRRRAARRAPTSPRASRTRPTSCSARTSRPRDAQTTPHDYVSAYVDDLPNVIDLEAIRDAGVHIGADPLGGA